MTDTNMTEAEAQANLDAAGVAVTEWRSNVEAIKSKIADAKARVAEIQAQRREHAIEAALDQAGPSAALKMLHEEEAEIERRLADLEHAASMAEARRAAAEAEKAGRVLALRRAQAREIVSQRIEAAARFDAAQRAAEEALAAFVELGRAVPDLGEGATWGLLEHRVGDNRIKAAVSPAIKRLLSLPGECVSLETSERATWHAVLDG
jgi:hypothetical protein